MHFSGVRWKMEDSIAYLKNLTEAPKCLSKYESSWLEVMCLLLCGGCAFKNTKFRFLNAYFVNIWIQFKMPPSKSEVLIISVIIDYNSNLIISTLNIPSLNFSSFFVMS